MTIMNVSQAKARFLDVIREVENDKSVIIEKKGSPVAAVLSYKEYKSLRRMRDYLSMHNIFNLTKEAGISAAEIYRESRRHLESRCSDDQ